jgi:hypothetical protein
VKVAAAIFAILLPVSAFAADSALTARLNLAGSLVTGLYLEPSIEIMRPSDALGFGVRVTSLVGLQLRDAYVAPCFLLRIGRVDLGAGVSFLVLSPSIPYSGPDSWSPLPVLSLGVTSAPLLSIGSGTLRFDFSVSFFVTAVPSSTTGPLSGFSDLFSTIRNAAKLELGLAYVVGSP